MKIDVREKRREIMWALHIQGHNNQEIGDIFNIDRSTVLRIVRKMPVDWTTKWIKR